MYDGGKYYESLSSNQVKDDLSFIMGRVQNALHRSMLSMAIKDDHLRAISIRDQEGKDIGTVTVRRNVNELTNSDT